jgi:hypothetical protein
MNPIYSTTQLTILSMLSMVRTRATTKHPALGLITTNTELIPFACLLVFNQILHHDMTSTSA